MEKINKSPAVPVPLFFSWLAVILGSVAGISTIVFRPRESNSIIAGVLILSASLAFAVLIRIIGDIGKIISELKTTLARDSRELFSDFTQLKDGNQELKAELKAQMENLIKTVRELDAGGRSEIAQSFKDLIRESSGIKQENQSLKTQLKEDAGTIIQAFQGLLLNLTQLKDGNQGLKAELKAQMENLIKTARELDAGGRNEIAQSFKDLIQESFQIKQENQSLKTQLKEDAGTIIQAFRELLLNITQLKDGNQGLKAELKVQIENFIRTVEELDAGGRKEIAQGFKDLIRESSQLKQENQSLKIQLKEENQGLKEKLEEQVTRTIQNNKESNSLLSGDLKALKIIFEQMNRDSQDMNENITRIKKFFEQIESHLNLNK